MQWSAEPNAGFTTGEPWLPLAASWREVNVAAQARDPASMLSLYKQLIALRRGESALEVGSFAPLEAPSGVLAYLRGDAFLVALNLTATPQRLRLPRPGSVALSTRLDREGEPTGGTLALRPDEGVVVRLERKVLRTGGHGYR
jgi:alpha-glucosidase